MPYGWTGTTLEVDLSLARIEKSQGDYRLVENYLGGKGVNAKLLWDKVPPEVDAFSPDNKLIISAGLLTGITIPGANRACITYKSPVTGLHCFSNMGGFFGGELKHAGYDTIIISGKSPAPVYLWIHDDQVEIRDASHLWGLTTRETQHVIRQELKTDRVQIMGVGPAGENTVYHATIEHSGGSSASRGGAGAVMGDKQLKAIAVYGTKDVAIANKSRLIELSGSMLNRTYAVRTQVFEPIAYTLIQFLLQVGAYGNFSGKVSSELQQEINNIGANAQDYIDRTRDREVACADCGLRCKHSYLNPAGGRTFMKCADWFTPMVATQILDPDFAVKYTYLCEKYGLDVMTTGNCIAFAIDLFQKGILTKEDTDGLHLEWKNAEVAFALIEKMARREGIGDILANGVYEAAHQIGRGAGDLAVTTKKLETNMLSVFPTSPHLCLIEAINDKPCQSKLENAIYSGIFPLPKEERQAYIRDGWFPYPKEFEEYLLAGPFTPEDYEADALMTAYDMDQYTLADATGICYYWMMFWRYPVVNSRTLIADLLTTATGIDINEAKLTKIAKRIVNLTRAHNVRVGLTRKDDCVPGKVFKMTGPTQGQFDPRFLDKRINAYYETKGWNSDGIPTRETLDEFGLDYVRRDFEQRGILTD